MSSDKNNLQKKAGQKDFAPGKYASAEIGIVSAGIFLALYTYRYYTNWIRHLENNEIDTDKNIYFLLALFIAAIGAILVISMIIF